jgi:hypothetical protein
MIIDGTNGLTFNNATTQASAGVVLQVVQTTSTSILSTTSVSFVTSGLSASITPKFATSKILAMVTATGGGVSGSQAKYTLYRGATSLNLGFSLAQGYYVNIAAQFSIAFNLLDSPATTSSTTYTVYFGNDNNNGAIYLGLNGSPTIITLMEIAA